MTAIAEPIVDTEMFTPTSWQQKDLRFLRPMPFSANWSQMGCFKTSTALWLLEKKKMRSTLIITSKIGKGAYFSDFYKCLPENWRLFNLHIHTVTERKGDYERHADIDKLLEMIKKGDHKDPIVVLAHYDCFTKAANNSSRKRNGGIGTGLLDKLDKITFDMIVCDEAHKLKNRKAQWTVNIKKLKANNKHVMTGTPFVNNPGEMWSLLNFLDKRNYRGYWPFVNEWCDQQIIMPQGFVKIMGILSYKRDEFRKMRQSLGPRHTMATVHKGITKPIEKTYKVELNSTQRRMYNEIKATLQTLDEQGTPLQSPNVLSMLNRLRQISVATPLVTGKHFDPKQNRMVTEIELVEPSAKLDVVMEIMKELDDLTQKTVVFSNFKDPLELLKVRLDAAKIGYLHMQQQHSDRQRYSLWHDQFSLPENQVFLSTLDLGGESINLTQAQYIIFLDRSWSPAKMLQAVGRVFRPGQTGAVVVIHINADATVDSYVLSKLTTKGKWFDDIFGD